VPWILKSSKHLFKIHGHLLGIPKEKSLFDEWIFMNLCRIYFYKIYFSTFCTNLLEKLLIWNLNAVDRFLSCFQQKFSASTKAVKGKFDKIAWNVFLWKLCFAFISFIISSSKIKKRSKTNHNSQFINFSVFIERFSTRDRFFYFLMFN
jgi:hypothetical protein